MEITITIRHGHNVQMAGIETVGANSQAFLRAERILGAAIGIVEERLSDMGLQFRYVSHLECLERMDKVSPP